MADGVERVIRNEGVGNSEQGEVDTTPHPPTADKLNSSEAGLGAPPLQGGELTDNSQPSTDNSSNNN
jgi:hypothetical protein